MDGYTKYTLKYFNLFCFIFIFILALLSKWTYWKPNNYGEHVIINAYLYGFLTLFSVMCFLISMVTHPRVFMFSSIAYFFYYLYALGKFYKHSFFKSIVKFLRFALGLIVLVIIISFTSGIIIAIIKLT